MNVRDARDAANVSQAPGSREGNRRSGPELVYRFRYALHVLIYLCGFGLTWAEIRAARVQRVWLALPEAISRPTGWSLNRLIIGVTVGAALLALLAAMLRTWGTAYLGLRVVLDGTLHGERISAAGPYRYVRNPLYLGMVLHTLALCLLMWWVAAVFTLGAILLLEAVLIRAEEQCLTRVQGVAYEAYLRAVPRLLPRLWGAVNAPPSSLPRWGSAFLGEIYFWGAAASFAALGANYNVVPILQGLVVSVGLSVMVRGIVGRGSAHS